MPTSPVRFAPPGWRLTDGRFRLAAYYVAFGPHGPRAPVNPPGTVPKVAIGVAALVAAAGVIFYSVRASGAFRLLCAGVFRPALTSSFSLPLFLLCSAPAAEDPHQGVGGGDERACAGAKDGPH